MSASTDALPQIYAAAWWGFAGVLVYFSLATILLRWRPERAVQVTRYEPPQGVSPALAAYLIDRGRSEKAFAVAVVSLAVKGTLRIEQDGDSYNLSKLRDFREGLASEEVVLLSVLFPHGSDSFAFFTESDHRLWTTFEGVRNTLEGLADEELLSSHSLARLFGAVFSIFFLLLVVVNHPAFNTFHPVSATYLGLAVLTAGLCLLAAMRGWPETIKKLWALRPSSHRPRRPFVWSDGIPVLLTATAFLGIGLLAYLTSARFAKLSVAFLAVDAFFRHALKAPTLAGHKVLAQLAEFREFLGRADEERLNRENEPGRTPVTLEKYTAYALALDIEHGWAEELCANVLQILQLHAAYPSLESTDERGDFIDLKPGSYAT